MTKLNQIKLLPHETINELTKQATTQNRRLRKPLPVRSNLVGNRFFLTSLDRLLQERLHRPTQVRVRSLACGGVLNLRW